METVSSSGKFLQHLLANYTLRLHFLWLVFTAGVFTSSAQELLGDTGNFRFWETQLTAQGQPQKVFVLEIAKTALNGHNLTLAYARDSLVTTSMMAKSAQAVVAINGGFFNVNEGYPVTYTEINGIPIGFTESTEQRQQEPDYFLNGSVIADTMGNLKIEAVKTDKFYQNSKEEKLVLVAGPLLVANSVTTVLPDIAFVNKRHPRSCLCEKEKTFYFIVVDGRSEVSVGMSLRELQQFLEKLGCKNALNLDGGGSSTLWVDFPEKEGVLNRPSDAAGERPVHNALILVPENQ
ncbi:phosphodiester glycosidase family protein [Ascidiimonas aurantiaca]|uniref:phosphodiester glycosidase family protein n=1 Tax=Ascidiimonas aurantiaca TaxID=1685432 RepID=UPI0030EF0CDA